MEFRFSYIIERDCDFAIINSFIKNEKVRNIFCARVNLKDCQIVKVYHSLTEVEPDGGIGESDIIFILQKENKKFGIYIEDKINANPQPSQRDRYYQRGNKRKGIDFDDFEVFLCAPKQYLESPLAKDYKLKISYESIIECLEDGLDKEILKKACENEKLIVKDDNVTKFWQQLYVYVDSLKNPNVELLGRLSDKSARSLWPSFKSAIHKSFIIMKSDKGILDLEIPGYGDKVELVQQELKNNGIDLECYKTGQSASIRVVFKKDDWIYLQKDFDSQKEIVNKWLKEVEKLYRVSETLKLQNNKIYTNTK